MTAEATARIVAKRPRGASRVAFAVVALAVAVAAQVVALHETNRGDTARVAADAKAPLEQPRADHPDAAEALCSLGDAYFERNRWSRAMKLYAQAIELDPSLRERIAIADHAIRALGGKRSYRRAARLIERQLGASAVPQLERAAREHRTARVRRRAARLLTKLNERSP